MNLGKLVSKTSSDSLTDLGRISRQTGNSQTLTSVMQPPDFELEAMQVPKLDPSHLELTARKLSKNFGHNFQLCAVVSSCKSTDAIREELLNSDSSLPLPAVRIAS